MSNVLSVRKMGEIITVIIWLVTLTVMVIAIPVSITNEVKEDQ